MSQNGEERNARSRLHCDRCHELDFHGDVPIEGCEIEWCLLTAKPGEPAPLKPRVLYA